MKKTLTALVISCLLAVCACPAQADGLVPMKTAWLAENEAFTVWYAKQQGWDKEAGLDVQMLHFDSGKAIVENIIAADWAVAGCGAVPALLALLHDKLDIIAVANDESADNAIYVRADSPILAVKGANPYHTEVYGDRASVKGKTLITQKMTSGHYLMASWLKLLGLTQKDVHIKYMEPTPAMGAFSEGLGDAVSLWAPMTFKADLRGFKPVALSSTAGASQPVLLVANSAFARSNPEQVEKFLRIYFRAVDQIRATPAEKLVDDYVRFFREWGRMELSVVQALKDIQGHPAYTLDDQMALFDSSKGRSRLQRWLLGIVRFYEDEGLVREEDKPRLERLNSVTDVYVKAIRK